MALAQTCVLLDNRSIFKSFILKTIVIISAFNLFFIALSVLLSAIYGISGVDKFILGYMNAEFAPVGSFFKPIVGMINWLAISVLIISLRNLPLKSRQ